MNVSNSECSSGCESGWTVYLDQTSNSTDKYTRVLVKNENPDQEDEDLSMVSDASSGPPQFQEYENYAGSGKNLQLFHGYYDQSPMPENKKKSKQNNKSKAKELMRVKKQENFCLDDTATSPLPHFAKASSRK
ncbi:protein SOB FIVE-LIKE 5-like [Primulina tabacum]|uniref:protein SOB FIVE-LIKE 5-like n=1 Tax=Primulina tabacum TaxID=48773 RepID=UPI003F5A9496